MQEPVEIAREQASSPPAWTSDAPALAALHAAAGKAPDDPAAHFRLAEALIERGLDREAVAPLQQTVRLKPDHLAALVLLGRILTVQGNPAAGRAALKAALQHCPRTYVELFNLGNLMREGNCHEAAIAAYEAATRIGPETASVHHNRGISLRALERLDQAAAAYRRAVELDPEHKKAYNNLGNCLRRLKKHGEAEQALRCAIELDPEWFSPYFILGRVLSERNRHGEALVALRKAARLKPDHLGIQLRLGIVLQEIGQLAAARTTYRRALELSPGSAPALALLAQIDEEPLGRDELDRAEQRLAAGMYSPSDRQSLHFGLAHRYDQIQEYGLAFDHLVAGNRLKRNTMRYDVDVQVEEFRRLAEVFDRDFFVRHGAPGDPSRLPIFVVGMPRSGTTLIEQILASHSRVHGAGEISALPDAGSEILKAVTSGEAGRAASALLPENLRRAGQAYVKLVQGLPHGGRIVDKALTNFTYIGLIRLMLPNARVIHVRRHPLDTCVSIFRKLFSSGLEFSYDLAELGRYYAAYARLMRHWHAVLPGYVLDVQYEGLIEDQRAVTERMLAHCGLEWEESCMRFHETQRLVRTASVAQVRQPLYRSAAGVWKRYGERLRPLVDAMGAEADPAWFQD